MMSLRVGPLHSVIMILIKITSKWLGRWNFGSNPQPLWRHEGLEWNSIKTPELGYSEIFVLSTWKHQQSTLKESMDVTKLQQHLVWYIFLPFLLVLNCSLCNLPVNINSAFLNSVTHLSKLSNLRRGSWKLNVQSVSQKYGHGTWDVVSVLVSWAPKLWALCWLLILSIRIEQSFWTLS